MTVQLPSSISIYVLNLKKKLNHGHYFRINKMFKSKMKEYFELVKKNLLRKILNVFRNILFYTIYIKNGKIFIIYSNLALFSSFQKF